MSKIFSKTINSSISAVISTFLIVGLIIPTQFTSLALAQSLDTEVSEIENSQPEPEEPVTVIETGTAAALTETYLVENIEDIDLSSTTTEDENSVADEEIDSDTSTSTEIGAGTTTELDLPSESSTETPTTTIDSVEIVSTASASTSATTTSSSGNNTASSSDNTIIVTGDSYAYSNVVNLTNTNIINSNGFIVFLSQLFGLNGADVRELFDIFSEESPTSPCTDSGCEARSLEYYAQSDSTIENNIFVSTNSGHNDVSGNNSAVLTGDAYAVANVTNIANTNIVEANYMMLTFSNFGDMFGDIVLPGKYLLEKLFQNLNNESSLGSNINISSEADIENNISTNSNTGNNSAVGLDSIVTTGNAQSYTNIFNQINTNVVNNDSFTLLFRVAGDWDGEIFGLPDGLNWERTSEGVSITNIPNVGTTAFSTPALSAELVSNAVINNNVTVSANTGHNTANGEEIQYIETGDSYAAANINNIANTNILGRNWSLLIFDIFGDWTGNISFGRPDLWIGGTANAANGISKAGQEVTYTFTVSNLGDAKASNVILNGNFNSNQIAANDSIRDINLGTILPGETVEKIITARVVSDLSSGSHPIDLTANVTATEPDENNDNNTEVVTIVAENYIRSGGSSSGSSDRRPAADLVVTKTSDQSHIEPGGIVSYEVSVTNLGGPVYGAILYDTLYNPQGEVIEDRSWDLETIDPDETVLITYSTEYSSSSPHGSYLNRAQVLGYHKNRVPRYMETYDSMVATVPLIVGEPTPSVLGDSTSNPVCEPYLTSYLSFGSQNDSQQVSRLQTFLSSFTTHDTQVNGIFDLATENAVRLFQQDHRDEVLEPWGLTTSTGRVYYTTQKKINELYCDEVDKFPLTKTQLIEITNYRNPVLLATEDETDTVDNEVDDDTDEKSLISLEHTGTVKEPDAIFNQQDSPNAQIEESNTFLSFLMKWTEKINLLAIKFWNYLLASTI